MWELRDRWGGRAALSIQLMAGCTDCGRWCCCSWWHWFLSTVPPTLLGIAVPGRAGCRPWSSLLGLELVLTLCGVLALAARVRLQHVLAAGTSVGEQTGLWGRTCPGLWDTSVAVQPGGEKGDQRAGGLAGSTGSVG